MKNAPHRVTAVWRLTLVEVAEFDCLHDEGVACAEALRAAGVTVTLNERKGTMHGFDVVEKTEISKGAVQVRVEYVRSAFYSRSSPL